jgi:hypothetical protein
MERIEIIQAIDAEIARLEKARTLLAGGTSAVTARKPGRPKASGRRTMSAEGRARVAAAQRKRWAKSRGERGVKG